MANYRIAYPALHPLASGAPDSPAAAIAAGAPLNDGHMAAATRQVKRRRILHEADPPRATNPEVQAAVKRELCVHTENAAGALDMPVWAQAIQNQMQANQNAILQALQANQNQTNVTLQALQANQNQTNATLQALQNQMNTMQNGIDDIKRMVANTTSSQPNHPICPVRNDAGNLPDDAHPFPDSRLALDSLTDPDLTNILRFYGLAERPQSTRLQRLKLRLGIRL